MNNQDGSLVQTVDVRIVCSGEIAASRGYQPGTFVSGTSHISVDRAENQPRSVYIDLIPADDSGRLVNPP